MTPIRLTAPDGTVRAYACGVCGWVGGHSHQMRLWNAQQDLEWSLRRAQECCTCHASARREGYTVATYCNAPSVPAGLYCPAHEAAERDEQATRAATDRADMIARGVVTCPECCGLGALRDCEHCNDTGEVFADPPEAP